MILRDAFQGLTRFDDFQKSLGIAPNILTRRLAHLVEEGIFEKRLYSERPARYEYVLTAKGQDFFPVLMALSTWGGRHAPQEDLAYLLGNASGEKLDAKSMPGTAKNSPPGIPACCPALRPMRPRMSALRG